VASLCAARCDYKCEFMHTSHVQDAEIGDQYDEFPAVLQLHLKRFEYDFERDIRVKVRGRLLYLIHSMLPCC